MASQTASVNGALRAVPAQARLSFDVLMARALENSAGALFRNEQMRAVVARRLGEAGFERARLSSLVAQKAGELLEGKKAGIEKRIASLVAESIHSALEQEFSHFRPELKRELAGGVQAKFFLFLGESFSEEVLLLGLKDVSVVEGIVTESLRKAAGKVFSDVQKFEEAAGFQAIARSVKNLIESETTCVREKAVQEVSSDVSSDVSAVAGLALFKHTVLSEKAVGLVVARLDFSEAFLELRGDSSGVPLVEGLPFFSEVVNEINARCAGASGKALEARVHAVVQEFGERVLHSVDSMNSPDALFQLGGMVSRWLDECKQDENWASWDSLRQVLGELALFASSSRAKHASVLREVVSIPFAEIRSASNPQELARACERLLSRGVTPEVLAGAFVSAYNNSNNKFKASGSAFKTAYATPVLKPLMVAVAKQLEAARDRSNPLLQNIYDYCVKPDEISKVK
ncbi:hypothetical protein HY992_00355 [Candidatus Micrarchaeota archaeon]|nr:hypothetical protein [Candidatus Micrarchaeota archaeon]